MSMSCILAVLDVGEVQSLTMLLDGIDVLLPLTVPFHLSMTVILMVTLVIILCIKMATCCKLLIL